MANGEAALATAAAGLIHDVFDGWHAQFRLMTRRAQARFERRDWRGAQADAAERLGLYRQFTDWVLRDLDRRLGDRRTEPLLWRRMKQEYAALTAARDDAEVARTFFNSITRRMLVTVGVAPEREFTGAELEPEIRSEAPLRRYPCDRPLASIVEQALIDAPFEVPWRDAREDARLVAERCSAALAEARLDPEALEVLPSLFLRNKGAYLVGRFRAGAQVVPLLVPLVNDDGRITADAALLTPDEVSVVFSFTRSYFHADISCPSAAVAFLRSLMPQKRVDEIYTSLGYNKHGKTELYRHLLRALADDGVVFTPTPGEPGLVMTVFGLPEVQVVLKLIRDRFGAPKTTTRRQVRERYDLVFVRDRVGRLADAQEFEHVVFRRDNFPAPLLAELMAEAAGSVRVEADQVIISHCYTERWVTPLDVYLRQTEGRAAEEAVLDYGQAIKDLAAANIFTGDMLLKNFGVTRHGRVIFYDYDELCLLTDCRFRRLPEAATAEEELAAEPWFFVGEHDVFPEEFRRFLTLPGSLGAVFQAAHADLFDLEFWRGMQRLQQAGDLPDVRPYRNERRLRPAGALPGTTSAL